ncbi:MAG TPA: OmpW family outer membrane protein [Steroidobacteraceae bacterium]|jgi:outer membrane protein|nr:OmpW family outer membrane protein [Steroidobacteraceae bacterium]
MKTINGAPLTAAAVAAMLCALPALADEAYNNSFRLGSETVFYHTKADDLSGPYVPAGVNIKAKDLETLYMGYVRHIWSGFEAEFAMGYPPLAKVEGKGPAALGSVPYNGEIISTARWLSPTVFLEYKFLSESSWVQPYIGVGVNYTAFYDRVSTAQGNAASGGPTKLSLTSSVGPAYTAGLSFNFSSRWHLYASYSIARVDSDLKADTAGVIRTTHISFGPQALVISGGYSF